MKKFICFCLALICCVFGFVGCDCDNKESEEAKYLRLYDLDGNGLVDEWESPYNYKENTGVTYSNRVITDNTGLSIESLPKIVVSSDSDFNKIINAKNTDSFSNSIIEYYNGTFFNRNEEVKLACRGAKAYIVHIYSKEELIKFSEVNLTNSDSEKHILVLESDINFRNSGFEDASDAYSTFGTPEIINLNGASLYGKGHTIEGFKLQANTLVEFYKKEKIEVDAGKYDSISDKADEQYVNLKYSLLSNASAIYDLNIHLGYHNINVEPLSGTDRPYNLNMIIDFAPLRNVGVIDNVMTKGKIDMSTSVYKTDSTTADNTNITLQKINVSGVVIDEDSNCKVVKEGDNYILPKDYTEDSDNLYDYDRLIYTNVTEVPSEIEGEEATYNYSYKYGDKITNYNTSNVKTQLWLNYEEKIRDVNEEIYFDSSNELNIGSIVCNPQQKNAKVFNGSSELYTNLVTGSSVNYGVISNTTTNSLYENIESKTSLKLTSVGQSMCNIGSIVGLNNVTSEVKNTSGEYIAISDGAGVEVNGYLYENETNDTYRQTKVAIGGIAGVNNGLVANSKAIGEYKITNCELVSSGSIAGAGRNGLYIKNISDVTANISNCDNTYSATVVGSTTGGLISSCVAKYTSNISATRTDSNVMTTNDGVLSSPALVSSGLLYFQSQYYVDLLYNDSDSTKPKYDSVYLIATSDGVTTGEILVGTNYSPKCVSSMVIDNTNITINDVEKDVIEDDYEDEEVTVSDLYVGQHVNLGGYFVYRFLNEDQIAEIGNYESVYNLPYYNCTFKINDKETICNKETIETDADTGKNTITPSYVNLYSADNNARLAIVQEFNMLKLRDVVGFNGVNKDGVNELINLGTTDNMIDIKNLKINNIYPGSYFSPDGYTDLQMDKNLYADLEINTYEEYQKVIDVYLDTVLETGSYNLTRKDLFKVFLMKFNLFEKDKESSNIQYKDLINSGDTTPGQVYELDSNGNLKYKTDYISNKPSTASENSISILNDKLYFGLRITGTETDGEGKTKNLLDTNTIYIFKKESLSTNGEIYNLPEGFAGLEKEQKDIVDSLDAIQIITIYRLSQIRGIKYVAINVDKNVVVNNDKPYSKLEMVTFSNSKDKETLSDINVFVLDTYIDNKGLNGDALLYYVSTKKDVNIYTR